MPSVITNIRPTTEVQAINVILGAIGEAKLPDNYDLSTNTDGNVAQAIELLKESTRDVLTAGWRFNTLTGFELSPTATYAWVDTAGVTTNLNIYKLPVDVLAWKQTPCSQMYGLDLVERMSLKYTEAAAKVMVLFDRVKNRDGADASSFPRFYIDTVQAVDFLQMPESARKVSTMIAAQRMCERVPASESQAGFTENDVKAAMRVLKREQGVEQKFNLFQTAEAYEIGGRRPVASGGYMARIYPGGA